MLVEPGRHWPFRLLYLNIVIPAAISLLGTAHAIDGARAGLCARRDETARQVLVETLPRCIPTLRYLTISRTFALGEGSESRRVWVCFCITDDRGVAEIPEWEAERVRVYCQDAMDPEAFDKFDSEWLDAIDESLS